MARLAGMGLAKEIIMSGEPITGKRVYDIGLVNRVLASEELLPKAKEFAKIVGKSRLLT